ncbi:HD family phosphohydrolase [Fusibacter sp. 3D3]|uniref:HD family phosphohydrolase n=1 Tax=Fusibacter sp. 3D3 TaxID=1048380 RepID=UPI000853DA1F|nr:HDIG domain-containing metalloprotein [Fusibacter sp. 3D3]GAU77470.1 membrane protein containing HD superfamily hydrolase domain [Fusibacter sp. 3D3]
MDKIRKKTRQRFKNRNLLTNTIVMVTSFLIVFFLFNQSVFNGIYDYKIGDIAKSDIYLTKDVIDQKATQSLKDKTAQEIEPIMTIDFSKQVETKKQLNEFFGRLLELKENYANDTELFKRVYAGIESKNPYGFDDKMLQSISTMSVDRITLIKNYSMDITQENMSNGIEIGELLDITNGINAFVQNLSDIGENDKLILMKFVTGSIKANKFVDQEKTDKKIQNEMDKIDDVVYPSGTLLVSKGSKLTERELNILKDGNMMIESSKDHLLNLLGLLGLLIMIWVINHLYLIYFERHVIEKSKEYIILMALFVMIFASSKIFASYSIYLIPIPVFAMLVGILLTPNLVKFYGTTLIILISIWLGLPSYVTLMYLLSLLIVGLFLRNVKLRSQIMMMGIYASLIMVVFMLMNALIFKTYNENLLFKLMIIFTNGIMSSVITLGTLPFFETLFHILTPFKLLELSNPNRELLKRLLVEAPGTYHHSILVGNLAETAAHDISANSMLARVGSFYHDIGKLERPYYFKENQVGPENPHDKLPHQVSANIIRNHTVFGVELAEKNKLPEEILQIIREHHGTSLIKYFYHQELTKNAAVDITKFLYHGPKPVSKEAVVVMLADSVEAAVRTLENPTKEAIGDLVDKIIAQKISEDQLSNSNITLKEIEQIKRSFIKVLGGIFHERIVYPEIDMSMISKETFNENRDDPSEVHEDEHSK